MGHTGDWSDRMFMAWASWILGAILIIAGVVATFLKLDGANLVATGASMITLIVGIIVAGKVAHDTAQKKAE